MDKKTEALKLADAIDPFVRKSAPDHLTSKVAADKLRRLHAMNAELLEALKGMVQLDEEEHQRGPGDIDICKEVQDAYAAIANAEGEQK